MGIVSAFRPGVQTSQFHFADDGTIPNNPRLPMIVHAGAFAPPASGEDIRRVEQHFRAHGWIPAWHNGIYPFAHYHLSCHEALFIAGGSANVRFGGRHGLVLKVGAGDVAVLPAGTGHQALAISDDLLVIGAYPEGSPYDLSRDAPHDRQAAFASICAVPLPDRDPVLGASGGVAKLWQAAR